MKIRHLFEENGYRLKDLAEVGTNFEDAHFWLIRKGTPDAIGTPTKEFKDEHIGIGVVRTDIINPDYLYYALMNLQMQGYWREHARGMLKLVSIRTEDVKNIRLG
jgi:hypothetical protein